MEKLFVSLKSLPIAALGLLFATATVLSPAMPAYAVTPEPLVAIHVSELTKALATTPATPPTPTGAGATGQQWFYTSWNYFVAYESLEEALRADGTPFVEVSDSDIAAGKLLNSDGSPHYPIMISLASEAIADNEIAPLQDYVNAGGHLFVGSSAFTRNPDGTTRGDFALAGAMGVHMATPTLLNWYINSHFTKQGDSLLTSHIPSGTLGWYGPSTSNDIVLGTSPTHQLQKGQYGFGVVAGGATDLADGDLGPLLTVANYGKGEIIYHGIFMPLIGFGGNAPGMYAYLIYRRAIEQAFLSFTLPIVKVSPWPFQYDAAYIARHDFENIPSLIQSIESSAQFEKSVGVKGDYYFCTGTLRDDMGGDPATVSALQRAVSQYGATIGSHNGGLKNPVNLSLLETDYDYWHWGPDEALNVTPAGYASGKAYASASILASFQDIAGWLSGLDNGRAGCGAARNCPRTFVSPYFNGAREDSIDLLTQLGSITLGEQKIGPFPHKTLSYNTSGKLYAPVTLPVSDWYVGTDIAQSNEQHTASSITAGIDFYYNLGALLNFYGHAPSNNGAVQQQSVTYSMSKPRLWSANSVAIADWWNVRSTASVVPSLSSDGTTMVTMAAVTGATDPTTAIEMMLPAPYAGKTTVFLNGIEADATKYRMTTTGVKVLVGSSVSTVRVQNVPNQPPVSLDESYSTISNTSLSQGAPGVLGNDSDFEGAKLTAKLVGAPSHGTVTLNSDGSFLYVPATNYAGIDSFTYVANDGTANGNVATATVTVVNQPPVAGNDSYSTVSNITLTTGAPGVLTNDRDPEGGSLTAVLVTPPAHGTLTLNPNGSFVYAPAWNYAGSDSFTYQASDGVATSNVATVTLTVQSQPPVANGDSYSAARNGSITVAAPGVLVNDSDPLGGTLTAQKVSDPSHGTLTLNANGSFTYTPTRYYTGSDSFTYTASNGTLTSSAATVTINTLTSRALSTLYLSQYSVIGGTSVQGTVLLSSAAPTGGVAVTLSDNSSAASLPSTVTVPSGSSSATFTITTAEVATSTPVTITGSYGGVTRTATLTVAPPVLSSVTASPATVVGGGSSTGTVTLSAPAQTGGVTVSLNANSSAVTVPASVTVPSGSLSTTFAISTTTVSTSTSVTISGGYGGVTRSSTLTVTTAASQLNAVTATPTSVIGGTSSVGTITLNSPAPAGGATVALSDDSASVSLPASVTVPAGSTSATFAISTTAVATSTNVTISAVYGSVTKTAVVAVAAPALTSLSVSPVSVTGGATSVATVTLSGPAPAGGVVVSLSDDSAAATEPASVTVAAGTTSASFTVSTASVGASTTVTISAVCAGVSKTGSLTVTPVVLSTVSGSIIPAPSGAGATVTLMQGTTTVATATAGTDGTFSFSSVASGSYTVTPSRSGFTFTPSSASVTVNGANVTGVNFTAVGLSVDASTYTDLSTEVSSISAAPLTTRAGNELLLAFVSAAATGATPNNTVTGVTGGGLTWTLVQRSNAQLGTAEIWRAFASTPLTGITVTATLSQTVSASITVVAFAGVNTTTPVGAVAGRSTASGAPTASLTTVGANSWVFAVGTDWDHARARTAGSNQTILRQYLADTDYTAWVQRQNATVQPAGTVVTISDTAPTSDSWNLSIVEIRQ